MLRRVCPEARQVDNGELRQEICQFGGVRADQQGADEQRMPGKFGDDPDVDPVLGLGATEQVLDEQILLGGDSGKEIRLQRGEMRRGHALVGLAPPDRIFGCGVADDKLVIGGTTGVLAGFNDQRTVLGEHAFTAPDRQFHKRCGAQIPVEGGIGRDTLGVEAE